MDVRLYLPCAGHVQAGGGSKVYSAACGTGGIALVS